MHCARGAPPVPPFVCLRKMSEELDQPARVEATLGCGPYQLFVFALWQLATVPLASNMVFMSFGKVVPTGWRCYTDHENSSIEMEMNDELCQFMDNGTCSDIIWETDFYSIVPQWRLVCGLSAVPYLIMSMQMLGVALGSPVCGQISDIYGRKWTLFLFHLLVLLLTALSVFSPNWQTYLLFRILIGFSSGGAITISFVLLTEFVESKYRLWVTSIAGWSPAFALFAGLAYMTKDWRALSLTISATGLPALVLMGLVLESPRWQIQKGKTEQAERGFKRVLKWNGDKTDDRSDEQDTMPLKSDSTNIKRKSYTVWHLCYTKKMTANIAVLSFAYLSVSAITYGVIHNNDKLTGSKYFNFFLFACLRWAFSPLSPLIDTKVRCWGRKLATSVPFGLIFLCTLAVSLIILIAPTAPTSGVAITCLVLSASVMTNSIWASLHLTVVESFPTLVRNTAVGVTAVFTRLGGVLMPAILLMAEQWSGWPFVTFALLALASSVACVLMLPETKGRPLPDTMPQRESGRVRLGDHKRQSGTEEQQIV